VSRTLAIVQLPSRHLYTHSARRYLVQNVADLQHELCEASQRHAVQYRIAAVKLGDQVSIEPFTAELEVTAQPQTVQQQSVVVDVRNAQCKT